MAIAVLTSQESGADSLVDINANFADLDTTKLDSDYLDTDGTLAANSDTKVATQKATKTYVDTSISNSSSATVVVPKPNFVGGTATDGLSTMDVSSNTTMYVAQFLIPVSIVANKVSINVDAVDVAGVAKLALYSGDGQTKVFEVSTANITGAGALITSLSAPTTISAGNYYFAILPTSTCNIDVVKYDDISAYMDTLNDGITSEPILNGAVTVTASTIPATITPASITSSDTTSRAVLFRLDN